MSITFPTSLDALTNPTSTDAVTSPSHADQHANANDAIEALEAKVGANSSAVTTSHDYKLSGVTGTDKAVSKTGIETLTNKTLTSPVINTPTGIVKGDVGLGNVDNTSDATKNAASVTLTNKTIALGSNTVSGTLAEFNTAVTDDNIMSLGGAETVTGVKTFNDGTLKLNGATSGASTIKAPAVASTYVHTLPAATDTLVGLATTDALTNKTLTSTTNNVAAKSLHSATTVVDVSSAAAPTTNQVLVATDSTHATWQTLATGGSKIHTFTTNVTLSSSVTETTVFSVTIPGGTLGTANVLKGKINMVNLGVAGFGLTNTKTGTLRLKYGATTIVTQVITNSLGTVLAAGGCIDFCIFAAGATNSQEGVLQPHLQHGSSTLSTASYNMQFAEIGTSAEDSTADKTLTLTIQFNNSSLDDTFTAVNGYIEIVH